MTLEKLEEKLKNGTATYADALKYAQTTGQQAGVQIAQELLALYPEGVMTEEEARQIIAPALRKNHKKVTGVTNRIQKQKNERMGFGLNAVDPEYNRSYENGIIFDAIRPDKTETYWQRAFVQSVENMSMATVDDALHANMEFQRKSGIRRTIRRYPVGSCCEWCQGLAGTYVYDDVYPKGSDVWRRHKNCDCVIEDVEDGKPVRVYNYREENTPEGRVKIERRKMMQEIEGKSEEARKRERHLTLGKYRDFERAYEKLPTHKIEHYSRNNLYAANNVELTQREARQIDRQITEAKDVLGLSDRCKSPVVVVNDDKILASYNPRTDTFYISAQMADQDRIRILQQGFACSEDTRSTMVHELYHWEDAEAYRQAGKTIGTAGPKDEYSIYQRKKAEEELIKAGISMEQPDKMLEISRYAYEMALDNDLEEVYTEFRTMIALGGK